MGKKLDDKLDCKRCGTILLDIPEGATEDTPVHCSSCGDFMGTWGVLQDNFMKQNRTGVLDLKDGNMEER